LTPLTLITTEKKEYSAMELGIHFVNFKPPGGASSLAPTLAATAQAAEHAGAAAFTLADHFFQMEGMGLVAEDPYLEGYTSLGFLAAQTERIRLAMLVTGVTYRCPGVLAKIVTTLDVLTHGRAMLGLGSAWYEREHTGLGIPFPALGKRFEMMEETLQICRQMWSDNNGAFDGKHYQLAETLCVPGPIQQPHPPILIGGAGEKKTLRLVAQYADAWNISLSAGPVAEVRHKIDVLRSHCEDVGRDPAEIRKSFGLLTDPLDDVDRFVATVAEYGSLGFDMVNVTPLPHITDPAGFVSRLGETVIPKLAQIG
jgi:F420-dependent oxidoreductase-like protein